MWPLSAGVLFPLVLLIPQAWMYKDEVLELRMAEVLPTQSDTYLCSALRVPDDETWYITGIAAIVDPELVHHIIVVTCKAPGTNSSTWSCGGTRDPAFPDAYTCTENMDLFYDWTKGVGEYKFPEDVGFKVGGDPMHRYLVLQVHYNDASRFSETNRDSSGLKITYRRKRAARLAGLKTFAASGSDIQPHHIENMEESCRVILPENRTLHVFSYLMHTHDRGIMATLYRLRDGEWTEIGRRSPQLPKSFVAGDSQLQDRDVLLLRCIMFNPNDHVVTMGLTHDDEMCFVRLMYYYDDGEYHEEFTCNPIGYDKHAPRTQRPRISKGHMHDG